MPAVVVTGDADPSRRGEALSNGAATVATWTGDDARRETYAEVGARAAQLLAVVDIEGAGRGGRQVFG